VLLVEHNFFLIHELCERVTVLDEGDVIFVGTPDEVARDPGVLRSYLARQPNMRAGWRRNDVRGIQTNRALFPHRSLPRRQF